MDLVTFGLCLSFINQSNLLKIGVQRCALPEKVQNAKASLQHAHPIDPIQLACLVLTYHGWEKKNGKLFLNVSGLDLIDQTPIIDIKPYLPYADSLPEAVGGFAHKAPESSQFDVLFTATATQQIQQVKETYPQLTQLITSTLQHNPRPVHFGNIDKRKSFGLKLYEFNIQWQIENDVITVLSLG